MPPEPDPIHWFRKLFDRVSKSELEEPSSATLATATPEGMPSARVVLLKSFDERGFVFYTNLESQKSLELKANPFAAMCFYWEPIHYQVRVQGEVSQVADEEADDYFASRPRGSQIGAWVSKQSRRLEDPADLQEQFRQFELEYEGREIPRPEFWSGFRLRPTRMEFWKRGINRLHERTLYLRNDQKWDVSFLYP